MVLQATTETKRISSRLKRHRETRTFIHISMLPSKRIVRRSLLTKGKNVKTKDDEKKHAKTVRCFTVFSFLARGRKNRARGSNSIMPSVDICC